MRVLIAGMGWLGKPLAEKLAQKHFVLGTFRSRGVLAENVVGFQYQGEHSIPDVDIAMFCFPPDRSSAGNYERDCLQLAKRLPDNCKLILCSSTSVIDAQSNSEKHIRTDNEIAKAELALFQYASERLAIVRLGGLIGPDRLPVKSILKSGKPISTTEVTNVIHLLDAIAVIEHCIHNNLNGVFAAVAPQHPLKSDFYMRMAASLDLEMPKTEIRESVNFPIHAERLLESGFLFQFPDPMNFPELL